ncbi:MAG: histidine phosphatase family protein [Clostridiaceae bacterium]|nr:histidine phosphatase family protein [Clostridiaceae bacterium]
MRLLLTRHGQTDWNVANLIQGKCDIELNYVGIKQADTLAQKLKEGDYSIKKIYTSILKRAKKTAEIIGTKFEVPVEEIEGLEEIDLGRWESLSWEEVKAKYANDYYDWLEDLEDSKVSKGESYNELLERTLEALKEIIDDNKEIDGDILIVTHSAVIMILQCYLNGVPFAKMDMFKTKNTEVVIINSEQIK